MNLPNAHFPHQANLSGPSPAAGRPSLFSILSSGMATWPGSLLRRISKARVKFPASLSSPCHSHRHASDRGGCITLHPVMLHRAEPQASGSSDMWEHWKVSCMVLGPQGSGVMYHNVAGLFWRARGCQWRGLFVSSCLSYKPTLPFIMLDAELWRVWHFHSPTSNGSLFRFC